MGRIDEGDVFMTSTRVKEPQVNIAKTSHRTGVWKTASPTTHSISPTSDIEEDPTANYTFPLEPAINEASEMSHEDDLVTSTILQGKLIKDRALLRKTQEHVQQLKTALQHKDKQLARMQENVESQYKLLVNYQHHEGVADARIAQLVTYVSALKHGEEMEIDPDALVLKANQENVVEALKTRFDKEKAQELRVVKLRNKMKFKSREFQNKMSALEATAMEFEDEWGADSVKTILDNVKKQKAAEEQARRAREENPRTLVSHQDHPNIKYTLDFKQKCDLTAHDDGYIQTLIKRSKFGDPLSLLKQDIGSVFKQFQSTHNETLKTLWVLFSEKRHMNRAREDFAKQTYTCLQRSKGFMADCARKMNALITKFVEREKEAKIEWALERAPTAAKACQADFPDPQIETLEEEIRSLHARIKNLHAQFSEKEASLELAKEKAESNLHFVQQKALELHKTLLVSLKAVHKHRFKWISKLVDPLRDMQAATKRAKSIDVTFNVSLGQVIERDCELLKAFAMYFIGDDYFGSDMTRREPPHHKSSAVEVEEDIYSPDDDHDPPEDPLSGNKPVRRAASRSGVSPPKRRSLPLRTTRSKSHPNVLKRHSTASLKKAAETSKPAAENCLTEPDSAPPPRQPSPTLSDKPSTELTTFDFQPLSPTAPRGSRCHTPSPSRAERKHHKPFDRQPVDTTVLMNSILESRRPDIEPSSNCNSSRIEPAASPPKSSRPSLDFMAEPGEPAEPTIGPGQADDGKGTMLPVLNTSMGPFAVARKVSLGNVSFGPAAPQQPNAPKRDKVPIGALRRASSNHSIRPAAGIQADTKPILQIAQFKRSI